MGAGRSAPRDPYLGSHLVEDPEVRGMEFTRRCVAQGIDPAAFAVAWTAGEIDPDAGYDPDSPYYGKDIATLGMLLEAPRVQPARRA